jgi:hypothetical protein
MCKNLDSPHPLTPSPKDGRRGTGIMSPLSHPCRLCLPQNAQHIKGNWNYVSPLPSLGEGLGVREKI